MEITVDEALALLRSTADRVQRARSAAEEAEDVRDALIRALDGQPGMLRRDMAAAAGITKSRFFQIAQTAAPEREAILDGVPMDQELYDALAEVLGSFARQQLRGSEAVRLDVHA